MKNTQQELRRRVMQRVMNMMEVLIGMAEEGIFGPHEEMLLNDLIGIVDEFIREQVIVVFRKTIYETKYGQDVISEMTKVLNENIVDVKFEKRKIFVNRKTEYNPSDIVDKARLYYVIVRAYAIS